MSEVWVPVAGYEGCYEVSSMGNVRSLDRTVKRTDGVSARLKGKLLQPSIGGNGYQLVSLYRNLKVSKHYVHILVAAGFCSRGVDVEVVRHMNGDCVDNRATNLAWGSYVDNAQDTLAHGRNPQVNKVHCPRGHELERPNLTASMLKHGHRQCLACNRARSIIRRGTRSKADFQALSDSYYTDIMRSAA